MRRRPSTDSARGVEGGVLHLSRSRCTSANSTLVRDDTVKAVRAMKEGGLGLMSTIGSISLCRSLLRAGLVDRFRVVMFPVITGTTGEERIYDGYPDVALEMIDNRTFDGRIQLVEYRPASSSAHRSTPPHDVARTQLQVRGRWRVTQFQQRTLDAVRQAR